MEEGKQLEQELERLQAENAWLWQEYRRNRRQELMEHLLRGEYVSERMITADLQEVGIDLQPKDYVEIYIRVLVHPPMPTQDENGLMQPPKDFREIYEDGLWLAIQEAYPEFFCAAIRLGAGVVALLQVEHMEKAPEADEKVVRADVSPSSFVEGLNQRALSMMAQLRSRYDMATYAAISRPHEGIAGIPDAHKEILEIDKYRQLMDLQVPLLCYHDFEMAEQEKRTNFAILNLEHSYLSSVELGDYEKARRTLHALIEEEFHRAAPSLHSLQAKMAAKLDLIMLTLDRFMDKTEEQHIYTEIQATQAELARSDYTVPEFRCQIDRIFDSIAQLEARQQNPKWLAKVLAYVEENFASSELNVASIALLFGLNASYLTREMKRCTGMGLLDLLQKKRLEYAMNLIHAGQSMVSAAEQSGFGEVRALRRAMKRYQAQ